MSGARSLGAALRDSRGGVLVMVAVALPALVGFGGMVIDIGNWFGHKRHLQVQADAAALAAAGKFRVPCADQPIYDMATAYSGATYNPQLSDTKPTELHRKYNSSTWYNQTKVDPTVNTAPPCTAKMIDVKLTETDLPWFLKAVDRTPLKVPFINAHARVGIYQKTTGVGVLPVAAPDVNPKTARAFFVDETTSPPTVIASTPLNKTSSSGGLTYWSNVDAPLPVAIKSNRIGVRIALSGSTSTQCTDPLVTCYDAGSANGLVHVRGWSSTPAGSATAPQARGVDLFAGSCLDGYFMAAPPEATTCTVGVRATVDLGDPTTARLVARRAGSNTDYPLTYDATTKRWSSASTIPISAGEGPVDVTLNWSTGCPAKGTCASSGTFGTVQRGFGGSDARSGPLKMVRVSENNVPGANSFERCTATNTSCTHNLVVSIGITGSLSNAQSVNDPIVPLKIVSGSQTQALDCDPVLTNLKDELAKGCAPKYEKNTGQVCPAGANALWGTPQPWRCVAVATGAQKNQVAAGLNLRILGAEKPSTCTAPNNWSKFGTPEGLPQGDPRIVQVFLTPFGAFSGSGSTTVPVSDFATFYITGWTGQGGGFANPCEGNGDDPVPNGDGGTIVGHFIKYIDTLNNGGAGSEFCDFDAFGACVAVLTR